MITWLVFALMLMGAFFVMTAAIGILRMPDLFLRMSASAKAGSMGVGLILLGVAAFFNEFAITTRALAVIFFIILTAPVASHMIARAAYFDGAPLWNSTLFDELKTRYHLSTHELDSLEVAAADQLPAEAEVAQEGDDFQQEG